MAVREVSPDEPTGTAHPIGYWAPLEKSWFRTEASATSENDAGAGKEHIKLGWSHSIFSNANLALQPGCKPLRCAAMASEPGAARLAHQTPMVKKKRRLKAVNVFNTRFTDVVIVTLCFLKVNPSYRYSLPAVPRAGPKGPSLRIGVEPDTVVIALGETGP